MTSAHGWEDSIRLSRLGRLPASPCADLSLPPQSEGGVVSANNVAMDLLRPRVDRSSLHQSEDAFREAELVMERKLAEKRRREALKQQTEMRSQKALNQFQKQHAVAPKKPWSISQPRVKSMDKKGPRATERAQAPLHEVNGATSPPSVATPTPGEQAAAGASEDGDTIDVSAIARSQPSAERHTVSSGREVVATACSEAPELEEIQVCDVLAEELSMCEPHSDDGQAEDRPELLAADMQEMTLKHGLPEPHALEEGEWPESSREEWALPEWRHPLGDITPPESFESNMQLVSQAGQTARLNLARHVPTVQYPAEPAHYEHDSVLLEKQASLVDIHAPFKTVVHHSYQYWSSPAADQERLGQSQDPDVEPRRSTPKPTSAYSSDRADTGSGGEAAMGSRRGPFPRASLANYEARAAELGVKLPPLCTCHTLPPLDPNYVLACSRNCPLYHNAAAWQGLVRSMLGTYGLL
eukprot:jgi/Tetstr1/425608/TSEL_016029.t1